MPGFLRHVIGGIENPLDASRETGLPASTLSEWRDAFVETSRAGLKSRTQDPVAEAAEDARKRLLAKIGELSMEHGLLAPMRAGRRRGPYVHDGVLVATVPT